jgi:hypothetical protein
MAATVAVISPDADVNVAPGLKFKVLTVTLDSSYTTIASGGEVCDLSDYFPVAVHGGIPCGDMDGLILGYERATAGAPATGKIMVRYTTSGLNKDVFPEADADDDFSDVEVPFLFWGK